MTEAGFRKGGGAMGVANNVDGHCWASYVPDNRLDKVMTTMVIGLRDDHTYCARSAFKIGRAHV